MDKDKASHEGSIKHHGPIQVTIESPWSDYLIAIANQLHMPHSDIGQIVERFCASSLAAGYALTQIYPDDPDRQIIPDLATMNGHLWPESSLDLYQMLKDTMVKIGTTDASVAEDNTIRSLKIEGPMS